MAVLALAVEPAFVAAVVSGRTNAARERSDSVPMRDCWRMAFGEDARSNRTTCAAFALFVSVAGGHLLWISADKIDATAEVAVAVQRHSHQPRADTRSLFEAVLTDATQEE